jgi:hypothetical protein
MPSKLPNLKEDIRAVFSKNSAAWEWSYAGYSMFGDKLYRTIQPVEVYQKSDLVVPVGAPGTVELTLTERNQKVDVLKEQNLNQKTESFFSVATSLSWAKNDVLSGLSTQQVLESIQMLRNVNIFLRPEGKIYAIHMGLHALPGLGAGNPFTSTVAINFGSTAILAEEKLTDGTNNTVMKAYVGSNLLVPSK